MLYEVITHEPVGLRNGLPRRKDGRHGKIVDCLIRDGAVAVDPGTFKRDEVGTDIPFLENADFDAERGCFFVSGPVDRPAIAKKEDGIDRNRITSYNVCYTKLLRNLIRLPGGDGGRFENIGID